MTFIKKYTFADFLIILLLLAITVICILPLVYELALSLSSNHAVQSRKVGLFPVEPTLFNYKKVFEDGTVFRAMIFSIWSTTLFTAIAMAVTIACAYPLTRPELKGRKVITAFVLITLFFSAGILPLYIVIKNLKLLNTVWAIILPVALSPYNMIILKTMLEDIPESMTEAAFMDGASYFQILTKIILPLSTPIIATLSLFYAVGRWNSFQDALFYLTRPALYTLQVKLSNLVSNLNMADTRAIEGAAGGDVVVAVSVTAATVIVAILPILLVYPKLQKYFISGVMLGSIKE